MRREPRPTLAGPFGRRRNHLPGAKAPEYSFATLRNTIEGVEAGSFARENLEMLLEDYERLLKRRDALTVGARLNPRQLWGFAPALIRGT